MSLTLMRSRQQDVCVSLISEGLDSETLFKRKPGMCFGPAKLLQWAPVTCECWRSYFTICSY